MFWDSIVLNGLASYLDHTPIILTTDRGSSNQHRLKMFRFEALWVEQLDCEGAIVHAWETSETKVSIQNIMEKLNNWT